MPPTMALLLVGLARTHVSHVYPLLKATLLKRYNPDVFLAMSTEMGCPSAQRAVPPGNAKPMDARGRAQCERAQLPATVDWLSLYPNLKSLRVDAHPPNATRALHGVAMPEAAEHKSMLLHIWRMYEANEAKRDWEAAVGRRYDVVVKVRPDWVCGSDYKFLLAQVDHVLAKRREFAHYNGGIDEFQVSDKFIVATSEAFDFYASVWERLPECELVATNFSRK